MKGFFDDQSLDIPCSQGHKNAKTIGWLKTHKTFACRVCGQEIVLDASQLRREIAKAEKALGDFGKSLR